MANVVDMTEQIIDGKIMLVGFELCAFDNIPIIDVGRS